MPRRKYNTYKPHAGTTPARPVTKGPALEEDGSLCRIENFHSCGATIYVGWRDFDTAHWRVEFFSSRTSLRPLERCPECRAQLSREDVRALYPDQLDPQEAEKESQPGTPDAAADAPTKTSGTTTTPNETNPHPQPVG